MPSRKLPGLEVAVLGVALVVLLLDAGGGPGWGIASARATLAVRLDRTATAPLFDALAGMAQLLPAGEPGFRLGVLGALLGALTLSGVVASARALLPRDPLAGAVAAVLLVLAPPFREAVAFAAPGLLAAAGEVWAIALAARHARAAAEPDGRGSARDAAGAMAASAVVLGAAPWLGVALAVAIATWLARAGASRSLLAIATGALGALVAILWLDATGPLPGPHPDLAAAIAASSGGAAAIVVGAGLLGVGFGAATGLPRARWLAALVAVGAAHEILVGGAAAAWLATLAIGLAIVPSALVRAAAGTLDGTRRHLAIVATGIPLVLAATATGATLRVDAPGDAPARLADDLIGGLPPGPGVFVTTRLATWFAVQHEQVVAGARPDLTLVPPLPPTRADVIVADAIRGGRIAGADAAAFGRLDVQRAVPRRRGFQLVGDIPPTGVPVAPPATYPTAIGAEESARLALERARHEAASGRLDAAARAAGLVARFGAADLAVLAATVPSRERPALFGFLPLDERPPGPWMLDLFGDDLAWVAGIEIPPVGANAPRARRLHARWRAILSGKARADDPEIATLGAAAVAATRDMLAAVRPEARP